MLKDNVETFLGCDTSYEESRIVLFGAPFDSTTSFRPGTRFASRTMRAESYGLETYSPYLDLDMEETRVFDGGDWSFALAIRLALWGRSRTLRGTCSPMARNPS